MPFIMLNVLWCQMLLFEDEKGMLKKVSLKHPNCCLEFISGNVAYKSQSSSFK